MVMVKDQITAWPNNDGGRKFDKLRITQPRIVCYRSNLVHTLIT